MGSEPSPSTQAKASRGKSKSSSERAGGLSVTRFLWLVAIAVGLYFFFQHYRIAGLQQIRIESLQSKGPVLPPLPGDGSLLQRTWDRIGKLASSITSSESPSSPSGKIRIATFHLGRFSTTKASKPHVMEALTKILRQFDLVAVQDIRGPEQDLLAMLSDQLQRSGRRYDFLVGPEVGRPNDRMRLGFLWDADRIETDRYQLYSVEDPQDLLSYEPLVGWFRARGIDPKEAFTFTCVNVAIHPSRMENEIGLLPELFRTIRRDGRQEDDLIIAGDFEASDSRLEFLKGEGIVATLQGIPTTVRGTAMLDQILHPKNATDESIGRAGVFDFLREFNLSIEEALEISDHLPVWADYSIREGGDRLHTYPQTSPSSDRTAVPVPSFGPAIPSPPLAPTGPGSFTSAPGANAAEPPAMMPQGIPVVPLPAAPSGNTTPPALPPPFPDR
jgi:hypothetical protein